MTEPDLRSTGEYRAKWAAGARSLEDLDAERAAFLKHKTRTLGIKAAGVAALALFLITAVACSAAGIAVHAVRAVLPGTI